MLSSSPEEALILSEFTMVSTFYFEAFPLQNSFVFTSQLLRIPTDALAHPLVLQEWFAAGNNSPMPNLIQGHR
ncbi:hypothetical protein HDN1F_03490 [gamma proteobacterium HdN1]|nr:hypothetical protein HDN1F_03490 [gamma proteobacterium HdN1]